MGGGGFCFEPRVFPGLGVLPWNSGPAERGRQLLRAAFLNLSFLCCKKGIKTSKLVVTCDFCGLTGEQDWACDRSYSEDRGPGMCWRGQTGQCPQRVTWGCLGFSPVASPFNYTPIRTPVLDPAASLRENQNRVEPPPLVQIRKTEAHSGVWKSHNPGWQCQKWNQTP